MDDLGVPLFLDILGHLHIRGWNATQAHNRQVRHGLESKKWIVLQHEYMLDAADTHIFLKLCFMSK